ncbi:MAG: hypothetical protein DRR00_11275 [Candidatus Parabeggiatoa sp. nov. 3]|nr:MAG: hypothetical protein DRR00_11275 [Gammaproteobacteria bacterium]RKZ66675.1 MAG: hypothetical protein DRQ99_08955 [Gammaproteobacteria bacterium]
MRRLSFYNNFALRWSAKFIVRFFLRSKFIFRFFFVPNFILQLEMVGKRAVKSGYNIEFIAARLPTLHFANLGG